jgi:hypothetical protein
MCNENDKEHSIGQLFNTFLHVERDSMILGVELVMRKKKDEPIPNDILMDLLLKGIGVSRLMIFVKIKF